MSSAFTAVTDWWDPSNLSLTHGLAGANEIVKAYRERKWAFKGYDPDNLLPGYGMYTEEPDDPYVVNGDISVKANLWGEIQQWIIDNCIWFIDHENGEFKEDATLGRWMNYYTLQSFYDAAGLPNGFRRLTTWPADIGSPSWAYGKIVEGDYFGNWVFEDLQKAFSALRWTTSPIVLMGIYGPVPNEGYQNYSRNEVWTQEGGPLTIEVTGDKADFDDEWDDQDWFGFDTEGRAYPTYAVARPSGGFFSVQVMSDSSEVWKGNRERIKMGLRFLPPIKHECEGYYTGGWLAFNPTPSGDNSDFDALGLWDADATGRRKFTLQASVAESEAWEHLDVGDWIGLSTNESGLLVVPEEPGTVSVAQRPHHVWILKWKFTNQNPDT